MFFKMDQSGLLASLYDFTGMDDGASLRAALIQGRDGNLYSTTYEGGSAGFGTVFNVTPNGLFSNLHSFAGTDGSETYAGLAQGYDGKFYGTTSYGGTNGNGTVFCITTNGTFTTLHSFTGGADGGNPSWNWLSD